jgi:hypothetical protein
MVHHHRNHPSVILWSIGNENVFGENFTLSYRWVKEHDPSRPVIYSYPGQVPDSLRNYEILSMHYPGWQGNVNQYGISIRDFSCGEMPVLFDEWAHVPCYNNFELKDDPNVRNFWGQSLDSMWSYTFEADGGLGGAIWCMLDETFMLPEELPGFNQWWGILDENVIPAAYMGPCVGYGEWGIADTWRRRKPEFWGTKKAYSPARVLAKQVNPITPGSALTVPVHNRFDHTNFRELKITWEYAGQAERLEPFDLKPHQKGTLTIPANDWKEGETLQLYFYQNDTFLVDRYRILLGNREIQLPACKPGLLEVNKEKKRIRVKGTGFALEVNLKSGLLENVTIKGDTLIRSGPYLNLKVPGDAVQYSTIVMDDLAENWKCRKSKFRLDGGMAILETEGRYNQARVSFRIRIGALGIMEISYEANPSGKEDFTNKHIQESGLRFVTGDSFATLTWKREPYFTAYPPTHIGRSSGTADLQFKPEMVYRQEPLHEWLADSRGFYYFGPEHELAFTNDVRSLKENIYRYELLTGSGNGIRVHSDATQACRYDRMAGENILIINDRWDYNSLLWGNYMKKIPLQETLEGKILLGIVDPD